MKHLQKLLAERLDTFKDAYSNLRKEEVQFDEYYPREETELEIDILSSNNL